MCSNSMALFKLQRCVRYQKSFRTSQKPLTKQKLSEVNMLLYNMPDQLISTCVGDMFKHRNSVSRE